jgi:CHASE1-domain containing sensor protein
VWPVGERPVYYPLARLEPPGQKAVLGYDGYSEPIRRAAMDRALATRKPAMTSMVILKSHTEEKDTPVFIVYAPILSGAYPASGRPDGRQITALVATMCRINDVLTSVLRLSHGEAEVAMYTLPADLKPPQRYGTGGPVLGRRAAPLFTARLAISPAGQRWELDLVSTEQFEAAYHAHMPTGRLAVGLTVTLLLTFFAWLFDRSRRKALSESDHRFRRMADSAPVPVWLLDRALNCTYANRSYVALTAAPPDALLGRGWLSAVHPDGSGVGLAASGGR